MPPSVNTSRPGPGRSGTRENRCPKGPPQLIDKSLIHAAITHTAKVPVSLFIPLVRFAIRHSKPGTGQRRFPLPPPGQTGRPHAADASVVVAPRSVTADFCQFSPVEGRNRPPEGEKTRSRGSLEERLRRARLASSTSASNRLKPESCCPGVDPGASCGLRHAAIHVAVCSYCGHCPGAPRAGQGHRSVCACASGTSNPQRCRNVEDPPRSRPSQHHAACTKEEPRGRMAPVPGFPFVGAVSDESVHPDDALLSSRCT